VPFYLRTGKALAEGRRTVTIGFTEAPLRMFPNNTQPYSCRPSELVFELSDDPKVWFELQAKIPGPSLSLGTAALSLDMAEAFRGSSGLEAYERLLYDVMMGDHLLFTRSEQIERLWEVCAPVLEDPPTPLSYAKGTWGPEAAIELPAAPGWRLPDGSAQLAD
jgi:glucose-6-phosphate 1-dehydrogenase